MVVGIIEYIAPQILRRFYNNLYIFPTKCLGLIVTALIKLLTSSQNLSELILVDLAVERYEANRILDHLSVTLSQQLKRLSLINLTSNHCFLTQIAMFSNLKVSKLNRANNIDKSFNQVFRYNFFFRFWKFHHSKLIILLLVQLAPIRNYSIWLLFRIGILRRRQSLVMHFLGHHFHDGFACICILMS